MRTRLKRVFMAVSLLGIFIWVTLQISTKNNGIPSIGLALAETERGFLVDTPGCKIPDIDPFDPSIKHLVSHPGERKCQSRPAITFEQNGKVKIDWKAIQKWYEGDIKYCRYKEIIRGNTDFKYTFGEVSETFTKDTEVKYEFIKVECVNRAKAVVYNNYHTFVFPHEKLEKELSTRLSEHKRKNNPKEILNVMMIGVDSVSRLNFMRQMPSTRKYLLEDLEAIEMLGYTKVADNTFVNIVPMTTGLFVEELPWNETLSKLPMDKYNYIWKNFSSSGYRTLYAEDAPDISIFTFVKEGFHEAPTHHYNRAFSVAMEEDTGVWTTGHDCIRDRQETDVVLKYVTDFATAYKDKPYFSFAFITRLTHSDINAAGKTDHLYEKFLKQIDTDKLLNNTVLIFFSDHGIRFGSIRKSFVGKAEERLPFMFFVLPKWFKTKYPKMFDKMKLNSRRLTTPFDIHATLLDILHFTGNVKDYDVNNRSVSLFSEVPVKRTCEESGILPHWCMCLERTSIPLTSPRAVSAADRVVSYINNQLSHSQDLCAKLTLHEITEATTMTANTKVLEFENSLHDVIDRKVSYGKRVQALVVIQVTIVTTPGNGMFEATVDYNEMSGTYSLSASISRINKYGSQSSCIDNFTFRKYCYCKRQTSA